MHWSVELSSINLQYIRSRVRLLTFRRDFFISHHLYKNDLLGSGPRARNESHAVMFLVFPHLRFLAYYPKEQPCPRIP
jgi:hypothetical protein